MGGDGGRLHLHPRTEKLGAANLEVSVAVGLEVLHHLRRHPVVPYEVSLTLPNINPQQEVSSTFNITACVSYQATKTARKGHTGSAIYIIYTDCIMCVEHTSRGLV